MSTDFSQHPVTIGELRSDRSRSSSDWSARDLLISLLRDIDRGAVSADAMVVVYRKRQEDGTTDTAYRACGPDLHVTLGLLERGKWMVNRG
jgi:hypothetical protein